MNTMFHPQLPILTLLFLFFILNHSILSFSAGNSPIPSSPYDDNTAHYDYCHLNYVPFASKQWKLAFGRVNTVATVVTILLTLLNIIVYKLRKLQEANFYEQFNVPKGQLCRRFLIDDILLATNHFDDALVIGQGGFGKVYKGVIDNGTITVAIKRLNPTSRQGGPEFWTEVEMLSKFQHSHIVSLIGYCNNCNEMILVYEYMSQGTLADHLHKIGRNGNNNSSLSWAQRLKICIGAARGLDYLHTGTGIQHRVVHRDVKSSNILLDENWAAKISDFGLSKTGPADQSCTHISTNVKGTFGYLDPEYFLTHRLTRKSDVYAFGVVLFEVLSGRRAVERRLEEEQRSLAWWAQQCVKEGRLEHIIDAHLKWEIFPNSLNAFAQIANQCLHYCSKERPSMAEVVAALESALALQQKRYSSIIDVEIFDICGSHTNQENADSSTEHQEVIGSGNVAHEVDQIDCIRRSDDASSMPEKIDENFNSRRGQQEVINVGNEDKKIDEIMGLGDGSSRLPLVKPARIVAFTRMVRQFFQAKAQVTSAASLDMINSISEEVLASPQRVPPSPSSFSKSPKLSRLGSVHLNMSQVNKATKNFSPSLRVGEGGFGTVYKAKLQDGQVVAIKRARMEHFEALWTEFSSEVELLTKIDHRNLVKLLGFIEERNERIIITEFVPNGTLREHLDGMCGNYLDFNQRLEISIDVAHGLTYLHLYAEKQIIHRDVKSSNILLTESMRAKVADFGFARHSEEDSERTHIVTKVKGTVGYLDPEYMKTYHLTPKSDVYSFGILLLEILTGRSPVQLKRSVDERVTVRWVLKKYNEGNVMELLDPQMKYTLVDEKILRQMFELALRCTAPTRADRPDMKSVGEQLWGIRVDYLRSGKKV